MTSSLRTADSTITDTSYYGAAGMSPADIFYATLNGEDIPSTEQQKPNESQRIEGSDTLDECDGPPLPHVGSDDDEAEYFDEEEFDFPDNSSFAFLGINFHDEEEEDESKGPNRSVGDSLYSGSRRPKKSGAASSRHSKSTANSDSTVHTSSVSSSGRSSNNAISTDEVKNKVWERLPSEIRSMIPKNQWEELSLSPVASKEGKRKVKSTEPTLPPAVFEIKNCQQEQGEQKDDDDDSVVSDISDVDIEVPLSDFPGGTKLRGSGSSHPDNWSTVSFETGSSTGALSITESSTGALSIMGTSLCGSQGTNGKSFNTNEVQRNTASDNVPKSVQFGHVQVRLYERVLDINPAVTNGAAIAIGWRFKRGGVITVDEWEDQTSAGVRHHSQLVMPRHVRESILKEWGYKQKDIAGATRNILRAKQDRLVTVQNLHNQGMEEALEKASRKVKGLLKFSKKPSKKQ